MYAVSSEPRARSTGLRSPVPANSLRPTEWLYSKVRLVSPKKWVLIRLPLFVVSAGIGGNSGFYRPAAGPAGAAAAFLNPTSRPPGFYSGGRAGF